MDANTLQLVPSAVLRVRALGVRAAVCPGSFIGRLVTADLSLSDPRISEAHALVSLRERALKLLALRGPLLLHGQEVDAIELQPQTRFELADGLAVDVESVELPSHALMLCGAAPGAVELRAAVYSLLAEPNRSSAGVRVVLGFVENAVGHLWHSGARLWIRLAGGAPEPIFPGRRWTVGDVVLRVLKVPLDDTADTWVEGVKARSGLVLLGRYTTVHVQRANGTAVITGKPANLVSELIRFGGKPIPWELLAQQIWGTGADRSLLRKNFDRTLGRLRAQLLELGIRDDLVGLDGSGNVELVLHLGDRAVDES